MPGPTITYAAFRHTKKFAKSLIIKSELNKFLTNVVAKDVEKLFNKRVANWKNAPGFPYKNEVTSSSISVTIYPAGHKESVDIFRFVSKGTKPHRFGPKNAVRLVFPWDGPGSYKPKTTGGGKYGGPGTESGDLVFRMAVNHPGIKDPREFPTKVAEEYWPQFFISLDGEWKRIIKNL